MENKGNNNAYLADPLSEVTRKERRMLLGVSMLGITLVYMGIIPKKITALGIEFAETNQQSLLTIYAIVVLYFVVAFLIYAITDFLSWRRAILEQSVAHDIAEQHLPEDPNMYDDRDIMHVRQLVDGRFIVTAIRPVSVARAIFEFLLPLMVGCYSIYVLLTGQIATPPPA